MLNSVNYGFQTQEKAQEYNRRVAEEAYAKKYKFFNNNYNNNYNVPHYLQDRGGMKVGDAHPATFFGDRYNQNVDFTYGGNNINVYGKKGMDMYKMPQSAFDEAMHYVDPYKIDQNNKQNEAIMRGIVDYHKKNEWAYYDPNIDLKAPQPKRELSYDDKKDYYEFERRNVENPYDVFIDEKIKKTQDYNKIMPKQKQNLRDYSKEFVYNHLDDGLSFNDGGKHEKYQYGMKAAWGAPNKVNPLERNTKEWKGDPNYPLRKIEEQYNKHWADKNKVYGKGNMHDPKAIYEGIAPYYDDRISMYSKQFKPGVGSRFNIEKPKNINYFRGDFNQAREYGDNYYAKRNDNELVFWKNNYDQRQYQGFNGKADYLYNDGRFLVGVKDKMNRPYNAFAGNQWAYKDSNHILNNPYAPLKNQLSDFNGKNTINYHRYY